MNKSFCFILLVSVTQCYALPIIEQTENTDAIDRLPPWGASEFSVTENPEVVEAVELIKDVLNENHDLVSQYERQRRHSDATEKNLTKAKESFIKDDIAETKESSIKGKYNIVEETEHFDKEHEKDKAPVTVSPKTHCQHSEYYRPVAVPTTYDSYVSYVYPNYESPVYSYPTYESPVYQVSAYYSPVANPSSYGSPVYGYPTYESGVYQPPKNEPNVIKNFKENIEGEHEKEEVQTAVSLNNKIALSKKKKSEILEKIIEIFNEEYPEVVEEVTRKHEIPVYEPQRYYSAAVEPTRYDNYGDSNYERSLYKALENYGTQRRNADATDSDVSSNPNEPAVNSEPEEITTAEQFKEEHEQKRAPKEQHSDITGSEVPSKASESAVPANEPGVIKTAEQFKEELQQKQAPKEQYGDTTGSEVPSKASEPAVPVNEPGVIKAAEQFKEELEQKQAPKEQHADTTGSEVPSKASEPAVPANEPGVIKTAEQFEEEHEQKQAPKEQHGDTTGSEVPSKASESAVPDPMVSKPDGASKEEHDEKQALTVPVFPKGFFL